MPKNTLYNYLTALKLKHNAPYFGTICSHDTTLKGQNYFHFNFKNVPLVKLQLFTNHHLSLIDHHLSIYEHLESSEYHYTAYFKEFNNPTYRIHVHFDGRDCTYGQPSVSIEKEGNYEPITHEIDDQELIELAITYAMPVILKIRTAYEHHLKEFKEEIKKLEEEVSVLSISQEEHRADYLKKANQLKALFLELDRMTTDGHYRKQALLLENILDHIEKSATKNDPVAEAPSVEENASFIENEDSIPLKQQNLKQDYKPQLNFLLDEIAMQVKVLKDSTLSGSDITLALLKLHHVFNFELLENLSSFKGVSLEQHQEIAQYSKKIDELGRSFLQRFLINKDYDEATKLVAWHNSIDANLMSWALQTKNISLLNFILQRGLPELATCPLTIKKSNYTSALHYCVETHSEANDMKACFSILLKYGATLLAVDNAHEPILFTVLSTPEHPLQALIKSSDLQNDRLLNRKFIIFLQVYLEKTQLPQKKCQIEQYIKMLEQHNSWRDNRVKCYGQKYFDSLLDKIQDLRSKVTEDTLQKLLQDPEIQEKQKRLDCAEKKYVQVLSYTEKLKLKKHSSIGLTNLTKLNVDKNESYEVIKSGVLTYLSDSLQAYHLLLELHDVQSKLKTPQKNKKVINVLAHEEKVLMDKINVLIEPYEYLKSDVNIEAINIITSFRDRLTDINLRAEAFLTKHGFFANQSSDIEEEDLDVYIEKLLSDKVTL